jgi:hypothetical protein
MEFNKSDNKIDKVLLFNDEPIRIYLNRKYAVKNRKLMSANSSMMLMPFSLIKRKAIETSADRLINPIVIDFNDIERKCEMIDDRINTLKKNAKVSFILKHNSEMDLFGLKTQKYRFEITNDYSFSWNMLITNDKISINIITQCFSKIFTNELYNEIEKFKTEVIYKFSLSVDYINEEIEFYNNSIHLKELKEISLLEK